MQANPFSWVNSLATLSRLVAQVSLVPLSNSRDSIAWVLRCLMSTTHRPYLYHMPFRSEKVFP